MSKFQIFMASIAISTSAAAAPAAPAAPEAAYMGVNLSVYNDYTLECAPGTGCDRNGQGGAKLFVGYNFAQFGVEAIAFRMGSARGLVKWPEGAAFSEGSVRQSGVGVVAVLPLSLGDVTVKGKLGIAYARGVVAYAYGFHDANESLTPLIGVGINYAVTKTISASLDCDQLTVKYNAQGKARATLISAGLSYRF